MDSQNRGSLSSSATGNQVTHFVVRHATPKRVGIGILWLFGLFAVFLAPAPVKMTDEKIALFQERLNEAHKLEGKLSAAETAYMEAEMRTRKHKVWFWRWKKEYRDKVKALQPAVDEALLKVKELEKEKASILRSAKKSLGVWSDAGLEESRSMLWNSFESGKVFAQRQTFWDALFTILGSRERDWLVLLLQLLLTALVNYTIGAFMAIITFVFSLPSFLASYSPGLMSAILFFGVAVVAGFALLASYLALIYASGLAVAYSTASFVNYQRQRIAFEQQQRLRYARPHGD